jgi:photosystem II stability/assembly factor-like uncharacterized protein
MLGLFDRSVGTAAMRNQFVGSVRLMGLAPTSGATNSLRVWQPQASGTTQALKGIHFVNAKVGWAVGASGTILASLDGGTTWNQQSSGVTEALYGVDFIDASSGWAIGDAGTIIHTTDSGQTWKRQQSNTNANLHALDFVDAFHGWVVGENSTIDATDDGGITWHTQTPPAGFSFFSGLSVVFWDQQHGWLAPWGGSPGGGVLATTNGGQTWTQQPTNDIYYLTGVDFITADEGWAASYVFGAAECPGAYRSHIFHTSDSGATWIEISARCGFSGMIDVVDTSHSWLIIYDETGASQIMASSDAGRTLIVQEASAQIHYLAMLSAFEGWAVGEGGTILHYVEPNYMFIPLISAS